MAKKIAGRVLMIPRGDYDASATYVMLDVVNHNNNSWLCKKNSSGNEPNNNSEYWQRLATSVAIDDIFDDTSANPVQNKIITTALLTVLEDITDEEWKNVFPEIYQ